MSLANAALLDAIQVAEKRRRAYTVLSLVLAASILFFGYGQADWLNSGSFATGLRKFFDYPGEIVVEAFQAGWAFFPLLVEFLPALIETVNIAAVATLLGALGGVVMSFLAADNLSPYPWLVPVFRRIMGFMRAFPELIIALFLIFVIGASPLPAMIAVAFHTSAALGKLFAEVNENVDHRPIEGLRACGATWLERMRFGVIPQVLPNFVSYALLRFEINVRASAILGFVGAGGIGAEMRRTIGWGKGAGDETAALFALLFFTIVAIDQISSYLRRRLTDTAEV